MDSYLRGSPSEHTDELMALAQSLDILDRLELPDNNVEGLA
jgi:hypothetical protein